MSIHVVFLLGPFWLLYQTIFLFPLPEFSFLCRTASTGCPLSLCTISAQTEDRPCLLAAVPCRVGPAGNHVQQTGLFVSCVSRGAAQTRPATSCGAQRYPQCGTSQAQAWHAVLPSPRLPYPHTDTCQQTPAQRGAVHMAALLQLLHFAPVSKTFFQWQKLLSFLKRTILWTFIIDCHMQNGKIYKMRANHSLPLKKLQLSKQSNGLTWETQESQANTTASNPPEDP